MTRNVFENNDPKLEPEDEKALGEIPHIVLPPLADGHKYEIATLPSGGQAVVVADVETTWDELAETPEGRKKIIREIAVGYPAKRCGCHPDQTCPWCVETMDSEKLKKLHRKYAEVQRMIEGN